ncbi:hypothetical protein N8K70_00805 [Microbacterium betulae]|uniref:DUF3137 domain-containing protein n=1 Tax=Microbacterium betulae TaxID=2981139 RepID=A0AA97FGQ9_9MICO|nr:hypothetical protein [Microbacterium sp. AB]WOF23241.1 hypothetical protein N8K70_00805 [Microbacterium sp. AB]
MSVTTQSGSPAPFDARALTEAVDRVEVGRFARDLARRHPKPANAQLIVGIVVAVVAVLLLGGTLTTFATVLVGLASAGIGLGGLAPAAVAFPVVSVLLVAVIVGIVVSGRRRTRERRYRLDRFARANGMGYVPSLSAPALPGMIFGLGHSRRADDLVRGEAPRFVEFANYRYTTGAGKNQTTHRWGYVAIRLDAPLPHIVLDALGNNSVFGSNLPVGFAKQQRLSLEGDFDRHFALSCPEGYEADALYLFTPDIMARFLDHAGELDVEIVDDWLFLYTRRQVSTLDPATWAWLFSVVGALLDKLAQWGRWRDERLVGAPGAAWTGRAGEALPFAAPAAPLAPPPGVTAGGRRLRRGLPTRVWVILAVFLGLFAFQALGGAFFFGRALFP